MDDAFEQPEGTTFEEEEEEEEEEEGSTPVNEGDNGRYGSQNEP